MMLWRYCGDVLVSCWRWCGDVAGIRLLVLWRCFGDVVGCSNDLVRCGNVLLMLWQGFDSCVVMVWQCAANIVDGLDTVCLGMLWRPVGMCLIVLLLYLGVVHDITLSNAFNVFFFFFLQMCTLRFRTVAGPTI